MAADRTSPGGKGALRDEMLDLLASTARSHVGRERSGQVVVAAAKAVIEAVDRREDPLDSLEGHFGSPEAALAWMREQIPRLEARIERSFAQATMQALADLGGGVEHG